MMRLKLGWFLVVLGMSQAAVAAKTFEVQDGQTIMVSISKSEMTRFSAGENKITSIWSVDPNLKFDFDKDRGDVFLAFSPNKPDNKSSFFLKSNLGSTINVNVVLDDSRSDTIILDFAKVRAKKTEDEVKIYSSDYLTMLGEIIKKSIEFYENNGNPVKVKSIPIWKGIDVFIAYKNAVNAQGLSSDIYLIKNVSDKIVGFDETDFLGFGESLRAVSLSVYSLAPNEMMVVHIVNGEAK